MGKKSGRRRDRGASVARQRALRERGEARREQEAQAHEELLQALVELVRERMERMTDPAIPAAELADLLADHFGGGPVMPGFVAMLVDKGSSIERLAETTELLLAADDGSLTSITFRADVARAAGQPALAREILDQGLALAEDDEDLRLEVIEHLQKSGWLADAVELFEAALRETPGDLHALRHYGQAVAQAWAQIADGDPAGDCGCGSGRGWQECCAPRLRDAVGRFGDRSALNAVRDAVAAYVPGSDYGEALADEVDGYLEMADGPDWEDDERAALAQLVAEMALVSVGLDGDDDPDEDWDEDEDSGGTVLAAFADDPATPPELAEAARVWREQIHYGLWRIEDPRPAPGLWCVEIASGARRYADFPPTVTQGLARWTVWAGALVPVDGIWHATGTGVLLSPSEGDAAADLVQAASATIAEELAGKQGKRSRPVEEMPFGRAEPHGVVADVTEAASPEVMHFISMITTSLLPRIAIEVHEHRSRPPRLANTDGDPMCLITARVEVDGGDVAQALAGHPDFEVDSEEEDRLSWLGLAMPESQRKSMLAEVRAQMKAAGQDPGLLQDSDGPQRWVRGMIRVSDGALTVDVNSRERLARLLDLLRELGLSPVVTEEKRIDPALDLAWPAGPRAAPRGVAPAAEGWENHWLDEKVPALRGRTPRQAAKRDSEERVRLEAMLRQFEYEGDLLAAEGKAGVDVDWLRRELEMDFDDQD